MNISILYYTLYHLKFKQIKYQIWYRMRNKIRIFYSFSYPLFIEAKVYSIKLKPFILKNISLQVDEKFIFLNQISNFVDWNDEKYGKLWSYNLNYMDYLLQSDISFLEGKKWINKFVKDIHKNINGLDSYPISLRGINWIKFISTKCFDIEDEDLKIWNSSLYAQYMILMDNLEYHLLGNHLLENAFSLLWGGLYFKDLRIYEKARKILQLELDEQILTDGAHFELSPMYHCIVLERLLDCINISQSNIRFERQTLLTSFLEKKASDMLGWLESILYEDGTFPLLNDSARKIAPIPNDIFLYAKRLGIIWKKKVMNSCGYRKFCFPLYEMIIDIGNIGADYIPGHSHADTFNYELNIDRQSFIVETGISTYNKGNRRSYERGTSAHNTVILENLNSSQTWDGFRVGKRAHIISLVEENNFICSIHDGFKKSGVTHERSWFFSSSSITIQDKLFAKKNVKGINRIIFSPNVIILSISNDIIITNLGSICFSENLQIYKEIGEVALEFNKLEKTTMLSIYFVNSMQYTIHIMQV